ncbi:MAG: hypothetical protein JOY99_12185 [Sphingomonadaceae bacterium]|nr:hypothetical protein [Sphingomonadaceae bacterium]
MITIEFDELKCIVRVTSSGMISINEAKRFAQQINNIAEKARRACGRVRILVKADGTIQQSAVVDVFSGMDRPVKHPTDRMAVIVSSSLAKIQARRGFKSDLEQAFLSEGAALKWLSA